MTSQADITPVVLPCVTLLNAAPVHGPLPMSAGCHRCVKSYAASGHRRVWAKYDKEETSQCSGQNQNQGNIARRSGVINANWCICAPVSIVLYSGFLSPTSNSVPHPSSSFLGYPSDTCSRKQEQGSQEDWQQFAPVLQMCSGV